jgi:hypothetical protein
VGDSDDGDLMPLGIEFIKYSIAPAASPVSAIEVIAQWLTDKSGICGERAVQEFDDRRPDAWRDLVETADG